MQSSMHTLCTLLSHQQWKNPSNSEEEIKNTNVAGLHNFSFKSKKIQEELQSWLKFTVNPFLFQNLLAKLILHC